MSAFVDEYLNAIQQGHGELKQHIKGMTVCISRLVDGLQSVDESRNIIKLLSFYNEKNLLSDLLVAAAETQLVAKTVGSPANPVSECVLMSRLLSFQIAYIAFSG